MYLIIFSTLLPEVKWVRLLVVPICMVYFTTKLTLFRIKGQEGGLVQGLLFILVYGVWLHVFSTEKTDPKAIATDFILILTYILPFIVFKRLPDAFFTFKCLCFITLTSILFKIYSVDEVPSLSLLESRGLSESAMSYTFFAFGLYFFVKSKSATTLLSLFFAVVTLKRAAFISFIFSLVNFVISKFKYCYATLKTILITMIFLLFYFFEKIVDFISAYTSSFGVSLNQILSGRVAIWQALFEKKQEASLIYFGDGLGSSYLFDFGKHSGVKYNLHSDLLKIYFEIGAIGLVISFWFFFGFSKRQFPIALFFLICLAFDNILIYPHVLYFVLLCFYSVRD